MLLGVMYENGQGVDVNYKKAIEWYEKAAEQGNANVGLSGSHVREWRWCGSERFHGDAVVWPSLGHEQAQARIAAILAKHRASSSPRLLSLRLLGRARAGAGEGKEGKKKA